MENKLICQMCTTKDSVGVYSTDYAPVSLSYCEECLKYKNIRPLFTALLKWARQGEDAFEDKGRSGCEPNVFFKDQYITLRKLVDVFNINDIEEYLDVRNPYAELIISKLKKLKLDE